MTNRDIAIFLKENHKPIQKWSIEMIQRWYEWFNHFRLAHVVIEKGEIQGIAFARPVKEAYDGIEEYQFDPTGKCLFVDLMICRKNEIKKEMLHAIYRMMGKMETIAFRRGMKNLSGIKEYKFDRFMKVFTGVSYGW